MHASFSMLGRISAGSHPAEDSMLVVQPGRRHSGDEELRAIGAWTSIGHGEGEGPIMPQASAEFVLELSAPDALPSCAIPCNTHICVRIVQGSSNVMTMILPSQGLLSNSQIHGLSQTGVSVIGYDRTSKGHGVSNLNLCWGRV